MAIYLGDDVEVDAAARVFRGWLGDRTAYAGFRYGDLSWQANPLAPVGINAPGARIQGHDAAVGAIAERWPSTTGDRRVEEPR